MTVFKLTKRIYKFLILLMRSPLFLMRGSSFSYSSVIEGGVYLRKSIIGRYCSIGKNGYYNNVEVGNYASIAGNVSIGAMEHSHWALSMSTYLSSEGYDDRKTHIGNDVWIGTHCVIRQGVTIGDGAVIGANSFVNKDIPPFAIAFGTPAKIYKMRFEDKVIERIQQSHYWNYNPSQAKILLQQIEDEGRKN